MDRHSPTIESIKENIKYLRGFIGENTLIMPQSETISKEILLSEIANTPYYRFITFADYHYFISRILFMNHLDLYSFFAGQQCIENYLKAFIRFKNKTPGLIHDLSELLKICKTNATEKDGFLFSEDILTIIYKYEPFTQMPRYPVAKTRTNGYITGYPEDIYVLDYFVFKFKEILPFPKNYRDVLSGDHYLTHACKENSPYLYNAFLDKNINFYLSKKE